MVRRAFDRGVTHFDLANNYGPPYGSAEENFGRILRDDFRNLRDELVLSSKAGWDMWPGPYGMGGSKKYLVASLDQSLRRMGLEYVDIFYHHRPDFDCPLEETAAALAQIVRQGKALYVGISSYSSQRTRQMFNLLREEGVKLFIHQPSYSMLNQWIEHDLLHTLQELGRWVYRLQSVGTGSAHKQVPERQAGGCACRQHRGIDERQDVYPGDPGPCARPELHRSGARTDAGTDGDCVGRCATPE